MKSIIYGIGKYYERYKRLIDGEIVAYVDKNVGVNMPDGQKTVSLESIREIEYDRIVVCSNKYADEIVQHVTGFLQGEDEKICLLDDLFCGRNYLYAYKDEIRQNKLRNCRKDKLKKYKRVYVLCPAYTRSGGPELLHQLVYSLHLLGKEAYIVYDIPYKAQMSITPDEYKKYVENRVCEFNQCIDSDDNLVIIPETMSNYIGKFSNAQIGLWWLSVDNFVKLYGDMSVDFLYENVNFHLYQSEYARGFLNQLGFFDNMIYPLTDYLNDQYLLENESCENSKEPIVLYNPSKGYRFTKKILDQLRGYKVVAIQNMTREDVVDLLKKSMVYIDFGYHPGKDRIPREAAISGCCVITGKRGTAANGVDVPIPDKYKFDENQVAISEIVDAITDCIENYSERVRDFEPYRKRVREEKDIFVQQIKDFFC